MTAIRLAVPAPATHRDRSRLALGRRLQAAFGAFLAPEKFAGGRLLPAGSDTATAEGVSLADPLALPPDWHNHAPPDSSDLLSLSFLPFQR